MEKLQQKLKDVKSTLKRELYKFEGTKEQAIDAYKHRIQKEIEMHRKILLQKYISPPEVIMSYNAIEQQKLGDEIFDKFGFDSDQLEVAIWELNLTEDKQFVALQGIAAATKQNDEKKFAEECSPSTEVRTEYLKKVESFGKPQFKQDQTMTFDFFLATKLHSLEYSTKHNTKRFADMKEARRVQLKELKDVENKEAYYLALIRKVAMQTITERIYDATLYQQLKVPEKVYVKSLAVYMMDPEKRKTYEDEVEKLRVSLQPGTPKLMTREEALDCTKRMEQFKFEAQQKMYAIVRKQNMPAEMINSVINFEKEKADDQFFIETGFEEEDVEHSVKALKLTEDPELKKITSEFEEKSRIFLEQRKAEAAAAYAQARQRQEQMRKMKEEESKKLEMTDPMAALADAQTEDALAAATEMDMNAYLM